MFPDRLGDILRLGSIAYLARGRDFIQCVCFCIEPSERLSFIQGHTEVGADRERERLGAVCSSKGEAFLFTPDYSTAERTGNSSAFV